MKIEQFMKAEYWLSGPKFLWKTEDHWPPNNEVIEELNEKDPEIKKEKIVACIQVEDEAPLDRLLHASSSWYKTKLRVAWLIRFCDGLHDREWSKENITPDEIEAAEKTIWKYIQRKYFAEPMHQIEACKKLLKKDFLVKLHPFIDKEGLLRVGGRLDRAHTSYEMRHPIILPSTHYTVKIFMENIHRVVGHLGKETMLSELRKRYWIISANSLARKIVKSCLLCRRQQGRPCEQIMADLPTDRLTSDEPVFSTVGIDCFGPFYVVRGRAQVKRYGTIFTCLSSRATHIEVLHSLETDSFIDGLRRFISRRVFPNIIRCDNGTNFVGAERELRDSIHAWNNSRIENWMLQNNINWKFQPPAASHMGGVFERIIRIIRKTLNAITNGQPIKLTDEGLCTLMCEVENILNSRPLTAISSDPNDLEALTPNHLLLMRSGATFPPGLFDKDDLYARRRWKQIQYLSNLFWTRWKKEYLPLLQERQKWTSKKRSLEVNDLVLLTDQNLPRNQWSLGRIVNTLPDKEGYVRIVDVKVAKVKGELKTGFSTVILRRPIAKLILLKSVENI